MEERSTATPKKTSTDPIPKINSCNGFYCDYFHPNNKETKPTVWTKTWSGWLKKILGMLNILNLISTQTQHFPTLARTHLLIVRLVFQRLSLHNHHDCDRHIIPIICYRLRHSSMG
ncbi:putative beta-galactosidase [Helianthus annuus]|nr:putative beta-galactosidase [Helianthus annuus]KAJ0921454.1 putative beta-galactosidase [Helianthus annuus]